MAVPILNGAASSLLSTLVLALGNSYVFVSFYKTMILVFVLGVLHSIVFLPVMLSFVGPRRTSKPRVFVGQHANHNLHVHHHSNHRDAESGGGQTRPSSGDVTAANSTTTAASPSSATAAQLQDIPLVDVGQTPGGAPYTAAGCDSDFDRSSVDDDYDDGDEFVAARRQQCLGAVSEFTDTDDQEFGDCYSDATYGDDVADAPTPSTFLIGDGGRCPADAVESAARASDRLSVPDCNEKRTSCAPSSRSPAMRRPYGVDERLPHHSPGGAGGRRKVSFDTIKETSHDDD